MKKSICLIMILTLLSGFVTYPAAAQDNIVAWNAKDHTSYSNGTDSGNDWYFYDNGTAEYTLQIPQNGIYEMRITKHSLEGAAELTVTADGGEVYGSWAENGETEDFLISDNVYFNAGERTLKIKTTKGGLISGFELELVRSETRLYKGFREWKEKPTTGADNGNRWYFYDNTEATYEFDLPADGKYSVLLNYQGTPANEKSYVTYNNYKYECIPGASGDIKLQKEIIGDITMAGRTAEIKISGFGGCNISGITLVLTQTLDTVAAVYADNRAFFDKSGNKAETAFGGMKFCADIINNSDGLVAVALIYARYDSSNILTDVKINESFIGQNEGGRISLEYNEASEWNRGDTVKFLVWIDGQKPITGVIEYEVPNYEIYVSADGDDDNTGTKENPYRTLERARQEVRGINGDMTGDINVNIMSGTYYLTDTLTLDDGDSGSNGYYVNWRSAGGAVEISGADTVTGWTKYNDNIYSAEYKTEKPVRQMTVNGKTATRAKSGDMVQIGGFFDDGVIIENTKYSDYKNQRDIQLHFSSGWKSYLMNVEKIALNEEKSEFTVSKYAIDAANSSVQHHMYPNHNVWIENAFEELDEEGEFYYDRSEGIIYYIPRQGENMETASVHIPVLETLIDLRGGDANHKVKNICFKGLTLEDTTWYQPAECGLLNDQAQMIVTNGGITERSWYEAMVSTAGISLNFAENVAFENNLLRDMGAVGIGLYEGVYECKFLQNTFCDIADSAMTVGTLYQVCEDIEYTGKNLVGNKKTKSNAVTNAYSEYAIDCNTQSLWSPPDGACWWQIDLEEPYEIDRIEIDSRTDDGKTGLQGDIKGVRILASNMEDFSDYTLLATVSDSTQTKNNTYIVPIANSEKYRYVRIEKDSYTCLANIRIINEAMEYAPIVQTCKNNTISNNYITRIGLVNYGAPAVQAYYTSGLKITDNEIFDVPYSGICVGWGWNQNKSSVTCHDNLISGNSIKDCVQVCFDGGAIYTLGQQPGTKISENYIVGQANHLSAIYLDYGSSGITVEKNVMEDIPLSVFVSGDTSYSVIENNYATSVKCTNGSADNDTTSYAEPTVFALGAMPSAAETIAKNAGIKLDAEAKRKKAEATLVKSDKRYIFRNAMDNREEIGYMNDSYFAKYWLEIYLDSAEKWIELSQGRLDADFIEECSTKIQSIRSNIETSVSDREKIVELYRQYREIYEAIRTK